ncbi:MAG: NADH-quinone oxidoreductase subunit D-related protein [Propionibacteriaceae bacterium]
MTTTYVLGAALGATERRLIDLGPDHPSRSGLVEVVCRLDGDVVGDAEIRPGASHRSAEKLFEVRDYRQLLALANRHDWQAPFAGELGAALTVEAALRLTPPPRATWLRTVLAEHARLHSHLGFLSVVPAVLRRDDDAARRVRAAREALREQLADLSGNRVHPMVCRLGGLSVDADEAWLEAEVRLAESVGALAPVLRELLAEAGLPDGVAVIDAGTARAYGVTGPAARAAGIDTDLRRTSSYLAYRELEVPTLPGGDHAGDAASRLRAWVDELAATAVLLVAAVRGLARTEGPVAVKLPKVMRVPVGDTYVAHEAPLGRAGWWLVSRGEKVPWRLKLRTASFAHMAALEAVLPGTRVEDLPLAIASVGYVVGDLAK